MKKESNGHCTKTQCMNKGGTDICLCPLDGVIHIIGKKWALLIISIVGNRKKLRFNEIKDLLGDISPKTLTDRLKELETLGLIQREAFSEIPPRVEYSLTKDGIEVRDAMIPLMEWICKKEDQNNL